MQRERGRAKFNRASEWEDPEGGAANPWKKQGEKRAVRGKKTGKKEFRSQLQKQRLRKSAWVGESLSTTGASRCPKSPSEPLVPIILAQAIQRLVIGSKMTRSCGRCLLLATADLPCGPFVPDSPLSETHEKHAGKKNKIKKKKGQSSPTQSQIITSSSLQLHHPVSRNVESQCMPTNTRSSTFVCNTEDE